MYIFAVSKVHGLHTWARVVRGRHEHHLTRSLEPDLRDDRAGFVSGASANAPTKVCAAQPPCLPELCGEGASVSLGSVLVGSVADHGGPLHGAYGKGG